MTNRYAYGEVAAMSRVGGSHHVFGVEHLLGKFRNGDSTVLLASAGSQGGVTSHEEVKTWERNHVDGQLPQIRVELTREAQAGRNTGHDDGHKVVKVTVRWGRQLESAEANIVQGLVVDTESLVRVLDELVNREGSIVRLGMDASDTRVRT